MAAILGALAGRLGSPAHNGVTALLSYTFQRLDGRTTRLRDWPESLVLCNFWATWCAPCRDEVPLLIAARRQFSANGLEIAGIGIDHADKLQKYTKEYRINYPVLVPSTDVSELLRMLGDESAALPYSVLLDRKRRIAYRKLGAWSRAELDREIRALIS